MEYKHIPKEQLVHGFYYKGKCRNATVARWCNQMQLFVYRRRKFGTSFLESIRCPEDEHIWDVFYAEEIIQPEDVTEEISLEKYRQFSGG